MKKNNYKKTVFYLGIFILFSFLPIFKASADLLNTSFTGPTNNTVVAGGTGNLNFIFTFTVPQNEKDVIYRLIFQPTLDGSPITIQPTVNGKTLTNGTTAEIFYGLSSDYSGKTQTINFSTNQAGIGFNAKQYSWKIFDQFNNKIYVDTSFAFKTNTNYAGFYYIYKTGSANTNTTFFSTSSRFNDVTSCKSDSTSYLASHTTSVLYKECQYYDYLPDLTTNEYQNISGVSDLSKPDDTYTLLAPIGGLNTIPKDIGEYFNKIFLLAIGLCGALAVIMIVISGVQYMGNDSIFGKTEAKSRITASVLGLLIALGSYALLNTINPDLLGAKGVNIAQVSVSIQSEMEIEPLIGSSTNSICDPNPNCPGGYTTVTINGSSGHICSSIKTKLEELAVNAVKGGATLGVTSACRSKTEQQAFRNRYHCSDPTLPPSACKDDNGKQHLVAQPGHSKHESGLAIDFSCNGTNIGDIGDGPTKGHNNPCYIWLAKNAPPFLNNLPNEPWHWSDDGQ